MKTKLPSDTVLTVIIRDEGPLIHLNEPVCLRSVRIELTQEQLEKLRVKHTYTINGQECYESISHCFLEAKEPSNG